MKKSVTVNLRYSNPPYNTWKARGHLPFKMYGETFAVTETISVFSNVGPFRVSHVSSGASVPQSDAKTKAEAKKKGVEKLKAVGVKTLKRALANVRKLIKSPNQ